MIYLDMDGVLVDLHAGIHKALGRKRPMVLKPGIWDLDDLFGRKIKLDEYSIEWWANLPRTSFASDLVECLLAHEKPSNIFVCTKPASPYSAAGKMVWMAYNYPMLAERMIICRGSKALSVNPKADDILIDDYDLNNKHWKEAGGFAITVPQPWNGMHGTPEVEHVERELRSFREQSHG